MGVGERGRDRRRWSIGLFLGAILALGLASLVFAQGQDGARDVMRRVLRDSRAEDEVVSVQMQLVDSNQKVIGSPSAPDSDLDGFGLCTWATSCGVPAS